MFGKNIKVKKEKSYNGTIKINEIFDTIQGEGPFTGIPAIFVRFSDCNLNCKVCDTSFETGEVLTITEIEKRIYEHQPVEHTLRKLIVITGGEPFLQIGLGELTARLNLNGFSVQIETAGTVVHEEQLEFFDELETQQFGTVEELPAFTIVCSPKTGKVNARLLPYITHWKYIIEDNKVDLEDGLPNVSYETEKPLKIFRPSNLKELAEAGKIYLNPVDVYDANRNADNMSEVVLSCLRFGYRVGIQLHKLIHMP